VPLWIEAATRRISGQWAQHQIVKILAAPGHGGNFAGGEHHHFLFCQEERLKEWPLVFSIAMSVGNASVYRPIKKSGQALI